jgi:hypothetical protein
MAWRMHIGVDMMLVNAIGTFVERQILDATERSV